MKKVIVACGGAVATSTIAAKKIKDLCAQEGIAIEICQIRISEIESNLDGTSLIVTTSKLKRDYGVPYVSGLSFISGIGEAETEQTILRVLKEERKA